MPVNTTEIINLLGTLAEEEKLKVTVSECVKCGLITFGATVVGGLLGGKRGVAVGGCIGSCISALAADKFRSVPEILRTMEPEKKKALAENVKRIMESLDVTDAVIFAGVLAGKEDVRKQVVAELIKYLTQEMQMAVSYH